jgi:uncharacterized repeat protein (TIGR03803 family)
LNPSTAGLEAERSHAGVTYDELYSFKTVRGKGPHAGLIIVDGTLYGTTYDGGAYFKGAVFKITKDLNGPNGSTSYPPLLP